MMAGNERFRIVGMRPVQEKQPVKRKRIKAPVVSMAILGLIVLGCLGADVITAKDPAFLDLANHTRAPGGEFIFGTDTLGRDIFSCIWYGGRISLFIGSCATAVSMLIAMMYGAASGMAPKGLDAALMRFTEVFLSIPALLIVIFFQAVLGKANVLSLSLMIGITGWCSIAKVIRTEVRQMRGSEYVVASACMGGGFFHILRRHLAPNFMASTLFMAVMNLRTAIIMESTLSFMGIGLPLETVSWGGMLTLAEKALTTNAWWIVLFPGAFLTVFLVCVTNVGNWIKKQMTPMESNL